LDRAEAIRKFIKLNLRVLLQTKDFPEELYKRTMRQYFKMLVTIYHVLNHHHEYRGLRPELYTNKIRRLERITNSSLQTA